MTEYLQYPNIFNNQESAITGYLLWPNMCYNRISATTDFCLKKIKFELLHTIVLMHMCYIFLILIPQLQFNISDDIVLP